MMDNIICNCEEMKNNSINDFCVEWVCPKHGKRYLYRVITWPPFGVEFNDVPDLLGDIVGNV